ncbi:MAG: hypothetical protein QOJ32_2747 [Frankiaceae bacterium]|nr:hypothetical protein [Frankiaceae bacterium]
MVVFEEVEVARGSAKLGGRGRGRSGSAEAVPEHGDAGNAAPSPARNILPGEPFEPAAVSFGHGADPLMNSGWGAGGPNFDNQAPLTWGADPSTAPLNGFGANGQTPPGTDPLDALQQYAGMPVGGGYGAAPAPDPTQVYQGYGSTPTDGGFAGGGIFSGGHPAGPGYEAGPPTENTHPAAFVPHPSGPADAAPPAYGEQSFAGQPYPGQQFEGQQFEGQQFEGQQYQPQSFEPQPFEPQPFQGQPFQGQPHEAQPFGGQPFGGQPFEGQPHYGQPFPTAPAGGSAFPGFDQARFVEQLPGGSADPLDVTPSSTVVPGSPLDGFADESAGKPRRRRGSSSRRGRESGHRPSDVENRSDLGLEAFSGPGATRSAGPRRALGVLGVVAVLGVAGFVGYTQLSGTDDSLSGNAPVAAPRPAVTRYPLPPSLSAGRQISADQAKALTTSWTALAKLTLPDLPAPLAVSAYGPAGAKPTTNVVVYAPGPQGQATFEALIGSLSRTAAGTSTTVAKPAASGAAGGEVMCGSQTGKAPSAWCAFKSPKGVGFVHVDKTAKADVAAAYTRELRTFSER